MLKLALSSPEHMLCPLPRRFLLLAFLVSYTFFFLKKKNHFYCKENTQQDRDGGKRGRRPGKTKSPNMLPKHGFLLCRREIWPLFHLPFLTQRALPNRAGPRKLPFPTCYLLGGVGKLSSQAFNIQKAAWRMEDCYSVLFQIFSQLHPSVLVDAKGTNPIELGQLKQQKADP